MDYAKEYPTFGSVAEADVEARATFIKRTYLHLFGAVMIFTLLEIALFTSGAAVRILQALSGFGSLIFLGAFVLVSWLASRFAHQATSKFMQYLGLGLFIVFEAIIFVPLLFIASSIGNGLIESAAVITALGFTGLTAIVFMTRKDFSFLRGIVYWGMIVALLAIVGSYFFGYQLGFYFSVAMVGLAGAAILYDTSNVLHHYPEDRYVGASLQLFASVALLFFYVLRILTALNSRD